MKTQFLLLTLSLNFILFYNASAASVAAPEEYTAEDLKTIVHRFEFYTPSILPKPAVETLKGQDVFVLSPINPPTSLRPQAKLEITDAQYTIPTSDGRVKVLATKPETEHVLGTIESGRDARVRIESQDWPDSVHGYLKINFKNGCSYIGTGILIGPNQVLTAGHNIFSPKAAEGWATYVTFMPARKVRSAPFGIARAKALLSVEGWVHKQDPSCDIGMIILDETIGNKTGWYGLLSAENMKLDRMLPEFNLNITGYPDDLGPEPYTGTEMWTSSGRIISSDARHLYYDLDTSPGQSGSGVWITYNEQRYVVGIHTYGDKDKKRNVATKINRSLFDLIVEWLNGIDASLTGESMHNPWGWYDAAKLCKPWPIYYHPDKEEPPARTMCTTERIEMLKAHMAPSAEREEDTDFMKPKIVLPHGYRIISLLIRAGKCLDAFQVRYTDIHKNLSVSPVIGGEGGRLLEVTLNQTEYLKGIKGKRGREGLCQVSFITNERVFGPFGFGELGEEFEDYFDGRTISSIEGSLQTTSYINLETQRPYTALVPNILRFIS